MHAPKGHMLALCTLLMAGVCTAQVGSRGQVLEAVVYGGDTIVRVELPEARVSGRLDRRAMRRQEEYNKLMRNLLKVYPYAQVTGELLREYEHDLSLIRRDSDRELYLKLAEAELRAEFEAELKELTMSQGRLLIKLIDRETGRTSYSLVKELKGSFQAFVWQGLAKLFGQDLKSDYDPMGEDRYVEHIVQRIERGELAVVARSARTEKAQAKLEKRKARLYRKYGLPMVETTLN